jgi:ligand-binding sensor domain-containing protein/DNA-binding CsgD family transcriptional regulator
VKAIYWVKTILLLAACFATGILSAQNTIGIPNIVNYSKQQYNAGSQNWAVVQDKNGIMYWANNDGLLSFDGVFWRMYKLPNKTIARSVAVSDDNKIYIGGQGEIGYFSPGNNGELFYTSLNQFIPTKDNDFADVWNICFYQDRVFFRANKKILEYDGKKVTVYNSVNWGFLSSVNGELLANEIDKGLVYYSNGQWLPKIKVGKLPTDNLLLRSALALTKDSTLLVSLQHGLFVLHGDTVSAFTTPDLKDIASKNISSACMISAERIALATNLAGCIIINNKGKFIQRFTKNEGIQNNNVLSVMADKDKNLWFGLDNGIDLVTYSNAIRNIFPDQQNRNAGYTATIFRNELYLGVSTGVYRIKLDELFKDISYTIGTFDFVENSQGQVWNLSAVNDKLLMGHNKGAYIIEGNKAIPLDIRTGFWGFQPLYTTQPSSVIVGGTYNGISFANYNNDNISTPVVNSQVESARFVAIGKNIIWIAHPYKGLYKISYDENGIGKSERYKDEKKILSSNHNKVFKLKDKIILTTDNGIFEYDEQQKDFIRSASLEKLLGKAPVSYLKEDAAGNIWFSRDRKVSIVDRSFKEPRIVLIPEIDGRIMANGFENILVIDSNNVLIAAEKGFFHINYALYKKNRLPLQALIRKVQLSNVQENGLIYGGYNMLASVPSIKHKFNSLHFECSSTLYGQELNTEYSYYLEGFDKTWSVWTKKTEKDYTNIPAGTYLFKVKCRNNPDNESKESVFSFKVLPPWYETWWAYSIYVLLISGLIYFFYKRQQSKYKKLQQLKLQEQRRKYDEEQKQLQLQHQLEIQQNEKQIIELRNEKLQSEVEHKNSELASSAMNLVQKKELLSKLKEDLVQYKGVPDAGKASKEFQKILKLIDKELDHNEEWEQFAVHFDSVHTNYLKKLKDQYPSLTTSDLKLAAYLRLNLSSKEIAQLMNISIRGVETSRYRLRKKLDLANEMSLFDHLIKITS